MTRNAEDDDKEHKYNFSKINTKAELFKAKQLAFGKVTATRGRPKTDTTGSVKGRKRKHSKSEEAPTESDNDDSTETDENINEKNLGLRMGFDEQQDDNSWDTYNQEAV